MTCDDCSTPKPAADWLGRLGDLFANVDHQLGVMVAQQADANAKAHEIAEALAPGRVVRSRTADRFHTGYLAAVPVTVPQRILGVNLARASLGIKNLSTSTTDVVWVAASSEEARTLGSAAFPLYGGDTLTIDTTQEVWVFAASGSTPAIAWLSTEYDLSR